MNIVRRQASVAGEQRMNPRCLGRNVPDTFDVKSAPHRLAGGALALAGALSVGLLRPKRAD